MPWKDDRVVAEVKTPGRKRFRSTAVGRATVASDRGRVGVEFGDLSGWTDLKFATTFDAAAAAKFLRAFRDAAVDAFGDDWEAREA